MENKTGGNALSLFLIYRAFFKSVKRPLRINLTTETFMGRALRSLIVFILAIFLGVLPSKAATTVYAASVFGTSGSVITPTNALGPANGALATILRVPGGSSLILQMSNAVSGVSTLLAGARLTPTSNVQIAVGQVIAGVATYSANTPLPGGFGPNYVLSLSGACATVSTTGCSLIRINVGGGPGSGFVLDGLSGVSAAPEPSVWALVLVGFGAVAWRLKQRRKPALAAAI